MIGDVVFIAGAAAIAWQVVILGLWRSGRQIRTPVFGPLPAE